MTRSTSTRTSRRCRSRTRSPTRSTCPRPRALLHAGAGRGHLGLNERVLDEEAFLKQAWSIHEEREKMFDAMEKTRRGTVVCVFDITDRLQHMFFRYLEDDHPANADKDVTIHKERDPRPVRAGWTTWSAAWWRSSSPDTVADGHVRPRFQALPPRGEPEHLAAARERLPVLKGESRPAIEWYQDVDWSKTRAYAVGLGGIYLNVKGAAAGDRRTGRRRRGCAGDPARSCAGCATRRRGAGRRRGLRLQGDVQGALRRRGAGSAGRLPRRLPRRPGAAPPASSQRARSSRTTSRAGAATTA